MDVNGNSVLFTLVGHLNKNQLALLDDVSKEGILLAN